MAEKIVIASLDIDVDALVKNTSELKKQIDDLKKSQNELAKSGDTSSEQFIKNASDLKVLNSAYTQNIKVLAENTQAQANQTAQIELSNLALKTEAQSVEQARELIKILTKERNATNVATEEGKARILELNNAIDTNNEFVKENVSAMEQQKMNVGNYTNSIKDALANLNPLNGGLTGFIARSQEAGGVGNLFKTSLAGVTSGFVGLTRATLGFIATPIGAVLAILVGAFALIKNALDRSSDATAKLSKITGAFSGVMNALLKVLTPIGEFLIDGIVAGFELAIASIDKGIKAVSNGLKFLGLDKASAGLENIRSGFEKSAKAGIDLAQAEKELEKAQRESRITQLNFQKDAEKLRQIRDDESKSMQERINANNQLGVVLKNQLKAELEIAKLSLEVANKKIASEGKKKELLDAQADALTEIADIQERITGQESEQLVNRNSLIKEANDKRKEAFEKEQEQRRIRNENLIKDLELEKQIYEAKNKSQEDNLLIVSNVYAKELDILDAQLKNKLISQKEYELAKLNLDNEFLEFRTQKENEELERIKTFDDKKRALEEELRLSKLEDGIAKEELKAQLDFEKKALELEQLQLDETQKTELLKLLEEQRSLVLTEIRDKFLNESLQKQKAVGEEILNNKMAQAQAEIAIVKQVTGMLTGLLGDSLGAQLAGIAIQAGIEAGLVKISTASAIATNLAQATAAAPPPFNLPFIAQAIGQNAILATKSASAIAGILSSAALSVLGTVIKSKGFADGGYTGDGSKYQPAGVVHKGEVVFSQADVKALGGASIVDAMRPTSNNSYVNGGIVARSTSGNIENNFIEMIKNIPAPIVTVEDINSVASRVNVIENNANF